MFVEVSLKIQLLSVRPWILSDFFAPPAALPSSFLCPRRVVVWFLVFSFVLLDFFLDGFGGFGSLLGDSPDLDLERVFSQVAPHDKAPSGEGCQCSAGDGMDVARVGVGQRGTALAMMASTAGSQWRAPDTVHLEGERFPCLMLFALLLQCSFVVRAAASPWFFFITVAAIAIVAFAFANIITLHASAFLPLFSFPPSIRVPVRLYRRP